MDAQKEVRDNCADNHEANSRSQIGPKGVAKSQRGKKLQHKPTKMQKMQEPKARLDFRRLSLRTEPLHILNSKQQISIADAHQINPVSNMNWSFIKRNVHKRTLNTLAIRDLMVGFEVTSDSAKT